jgi:hypothetical protein
LQNTRNCFEHRGGIVGSKDVAQDGIMELSFPRMKIFYLRNGEEIEVVEGGAPVDTGDDEPEVDILLRLDVRVRRYNLGERLTLTVADFDEIAFACYHFGSQLVTGLAGLHGAAGAPQPQACAPAQGVCG